MALKGNLKDFSTTQLLNLINLAKKSGTLNINGTSDNKAKVAFRDGKLIYAAFGSSDGNLAGVLATAGKLTAKQAEQINARAKNTTDKQLGLLLINAGYVTQTDIIQSIKKNIRDVVFKLLSWTEGNFQFDAGTMPPADRITVPINLENIIIEGSRRIKELDRLEEEIPNLDMALKFPKQRDKALGKVNLSVEEWRVVSFVKPENTMRMIAKAHSMSDQELRKIVYGLLQAGLVELTRPAGAKTQQLGGTTRRRARAEEPEVKAKVVNKLIDRIKTL